MRGAVRRAVVVPGTLVVMLASAAGSAVSGSHIYWASFNIYWANFNAGTIGRANLNGTGASQSFITGASDPLGWRSAHSEQWPGSGRPGHVLGRRGQGAPPP
jgi:hypothetical protein